MTRTPSGIPGKRSDPNLSGPDQRGGLHHPDFGLDHALVFPPQSGLDHPPVRTTGVWSGPTRGLDHRGVVQTTRGGLDHTRVVWTTGWSRPLHSGRDQGGLVQTK